MCACFTCLVAETSLLWLFVYGEVAEWFKAPVLKTGEGEIPP